MNIYMMGLSFRTADVDVREQVAFTRPQLAGALHNLCSYTSIRGAVIVSTCNRMEVYVDTSNPHDARDEIVSFLASYRKIEADRLQAHLYERHGFEAAHHLFSVISSLDSMVLGEQQIAGQVRTAFKEAAQAGSCTMVLAHLFRQALSVSKRVRNQTAISENHVSVSTVAIDLAREAFESFTDKTVLVVGSGEMSELAARYLKDLGVRSFIVSSRTYAHASSLARELGGSARYFEELETLLQSADIVLSSTAAPRPIITPDLIGKRTKPLFMLDIALPRDIDAACKDIPYVTLYDLDDISERIEQNKSARQTAACEARALVDEETQQFVHWVGEHAVTPMIKRMREDAEAIRVQEVAHLRRVLETELSACDIEAIDAATRAIINKLLHMPTIRMKQSATDNADFECVEAVRYLFGYSQGMVGHAHALDAGLPAAPHTVPSHASEVHAVIHEEAEELPGADDADSSLQHPISTPSAAVAVSA